MITLHPSLKLRGEVTVPGDKSISHRSVMFGAIAKGDTAIEGFLDSADCRSTMNCFRSMGIGIEEDISGGGASPRIIVHGKGLRGLSAPSSFLDCGNSGTTTRLISGILAAQPFDCTLMGDESLSRRPMKRVITPLSEMGASITSKNGCLPLTISGRQLHGITYSSPVASAQVKSAILLAGLYADSPTMVFEPALSRDHTERMLTGFGARIMRPGCMESGAAVTIYPADELTAQAITVPGDISSAAYFLAAGAIVPGSEILIRNVGINPTRAGILPVLARMGAAVELVDERTVSGEPAADLLVRHSSLKGTEIGGAEIPTLIDELPVIAVCAALAEGTTVIRDAAELRVKESDRIAAMTEVLGSMGADVMPTEDGMIIRGGRPLHGAVIDSRMDHRIAMSAAVAALAAGGETSIKDEECVGISYPSFFRDLAALA